MSQSIDFLPPELRPKKKLYRTAGRSLQYTSPQADVAAAGPQPAAAKPKKSWLASLAGLFHRSPATAAPAVRQVAREKLLRPVPAVAVAATAPVPPLAPIRPEPPVVPAKPTPQPATPVPPPAAVPVPLPATAVRPVRLAGGKLFGTNLMRGQEFQFFDWQRAGIVIGSITVIVIAVLWGIRWQIQRSGVQLATVAYETELAQRRTSLAELQKTAEGFSGLQRQAQWANALLQEHVYWSNFFTYLEEQTVPGVWYEDFSGKTGDEYALKAQAPDFETFIRQLQVWKEADTTYTRFFSVDEVSLDAGEGAGETVEFSVTFAVTPELFAYRNR